jgi:solute carrier family 25 (mitochondrial ornithine transporter) member 2/15
MSKEIFKSSGFRGFFHGLVPTFAREMPGYFCFFGAYEFTRDLFATHMKTDKNDIGILRTALCGGLGGVSLWTVIYPADVVKSRFQIDSKSDLAKGGFLNALKTILVNEGIAKLYSGLGPTIIRSFFATGALFVTVEETKKFLKQFINQP